MKIGVLFCVAGVLLALPVRAAEEARRLFVATNGNDAWSGALAAPNAARTDGPFATLERARDAVRASNTEKKPVTILVRGGLYPLARTLKLDKEDSGTPQAPVVYRAFENEKPIIIGGRAISNFQPHEGQIVKADVGAQGFKDIYFRQLFFDGKRQHLARYPNFDANNPYGGGWAYADGKPVPMYAEIPGEDKRTFTMKAQDARTWARPEEAEVMVFPRFNWWNNIVRIASLERETRKITLAGDASYPIRPGDRYFVRNVREELDAPGEWYLDKPTSTLYFWPPATLQGKAVYAPTMRTILEIGADTQYVTFRGFTFEGCEGTAIALNGARNCLIAGNTIRNAGDYNGSGIAVNGGANNGVVGNDIYEIGRDGVYLSGGDRITLTAANNYADNNYIHHVGVFYKQGVGISMSGCGNRASHNLIHDAPRMGIIFGGNNLLIEYNHIRHINLETEDTGAVYTGGRDWLGSRGTVIRHNYFHDSLGYGQENGKWMSPHFAWGIYLDDNAGGVDVIGNIVARAARGLIHLHNGRDNLIENNVFVDARLQQVEYNGWTTAHRYWQQHLPSMIKGYESVKGQPAWRNMRNMNIHPTQAPLPDGKIMTGNVLRRNIIFYRDPKAKAVKMANVPLERNTSDYNLFYHFGQPILTGQSMVKGVVGPNLTPNGDFEEGTIGEIPTRWKWNIKHPTAKATLSNGEKHGGARSLRIDAGTTHDDKGQPKFPMLQSDAFPAKPGATYRLRAWLKADHADAKAAIVAQAWKADTYHWATSHPVVVGTQWQQVEWVFRFPAAGESGSHPQMQSFYVRLDWNEESGTLWVDDITVHEATTMDEWQAWQALGQDRNSLIADPLFVNPAKDDYRLRPNSPAFKLGFKPIPVEKIGPYADAMRATWPIVEAEGAREKPLVSSP
jgi:hypothetical protein